MRQNKSIDSRNKISSFLTKEEKKNCKTNKLYMGKNILKTLLTDVLRNEKKIISSITKEKIDYQTNKLHMGKYILITPLARVLINKINCPHTKEEIIY